jgi:hypothetical protein
MTLGQALGTIWHSFETTNVNGEKVQIKIGFDCTSATDDQVRGWVVSNRVIASQRPFRLLSADEIKALDGSVIDATSCGQKIRSKHEQFMIGLKALRAAGMNDEADALEAAYNEKKQN